MSKIAKLMQLFQEGAVCEAGPVTIWVNKLSPFTQAQADQEGRVARARKMMEIREVGSDEYVIFQSQLAGSTRQAIINGYLSAKNPETLARVLRDIRSDKEWIEKIEIIEHSAEHLQGLKPDDPQVKTFRLALTQWEQEITKRVDEAIKDFRRELDGLSDAVLRERFEEHWIESQGLAAFNNTRQRYELFYAARQCSGTKVLDDNGEWDSQTWDHAGCDHTVQLLDDPGDISDLPGDVIEKILSTLMDVTVPTDIARFTDGPASSSGSSGPSSSAEGSAASGPEATPPEPAPTSS